MAEKKEMSQKKRVVVFVLISALAMVICLGVVMGVAISLMTDGVYEFEEVVKEYKAPKDGQGTVDFVLAAIEEAKDENVVYLNTWVNQSIDNLEYSGSESERKLLDHMKGTIAGNIDAMYPGDYNGSFADGFKDYPVIDLAGVNVTETANEVNGTKIRSTVKADKFISAFDPKDDEKAAEQIKKELADVLTVTKSDVKPAGIEIVSEINVNAPEVNNAGRITKLEIKRIYDVKLTAEFKNDLASLETRDFTFTYSVTEGYGYTWAGIECTNEYYLAKGDETQLGVNAKLNDYSDYETRFVSSNEEIATIDEIGYITAVGESEEPAIITVYLDYLGHEYSAQCKVYVTTPVEKIKISEKELNIKKGETAELTATLEPEEATIKNVIWISDDEKIAAVEDGKITAVAAGTTIIRAVAQDGNFQAICTVTVS